MTFPSTSLYTIFEDEELSPQPSNMGNFDFNLQEKALPIHPLNTVLIQQKHIRFCKELTDYFVNSGSDIAQGMFSEIDDALKNTQLDMLRALYGGSEVRDNKGDFKSLWEDDCFYAYEDIDPEIGKRIKAARQARALRMGSRQTNDAIHRGSGDSRAAVKREGADDVNEEEDVDDDISSIMGDNALFSQTGKKQARTYNLTEILESIGPPQPSAYKRSDTPFLRREPDTASSDRAKKYWWRRKLAKDKQGNKKTKMEYPHPYGQETYRHINLIAPDKRARDENRYDQQAMAEDEARMRNVPIQKSRDYIRQMPSPSQFDDLNASVNMTRFRYSTEVRSINSEDWPISQRGDAPPDRILQPVTEDGMDLEMLLGQIDKIYKKRCIPLTQKYSLRRYEIDHDSELAQEEKAEALAKLAEEEGREYKELADQTGKTYRNDSDVMRHLMRLAKDMRTKALETEKKEPPPPPKSTMGRLRSAGGKTLNWFLSIPDDDDLTSEAVYIPYGATNMFLQPLQPHTKVSASDTGVSTLGSSTGESHGRSMNEERKRLHGRRRSEDAPRGDRLREDARYVEIRREDSPKKPDSARQQQRYYERDFELRERELSEAGTKVTQMPTQSEFEGKLF